MYPENKNNVTIDMPYTSEKGTETSKYNSDTPKCSSYDNRKTHHYCDHSCAISHLQKIVKAKSKEKKTAKASELDVNTGILTLDMSIK
jgi:hypothetical protein